MSPEPQTAAELRAHYADVFARTRAPCRPVSVVLPVQVAPKRKVDPALPRARHDWPRDLRHLPAPVRAKVIIADTARCHGLTPEDITGPGRTSRLVEARFDAIASVAHACPTFSIPKIGSIFNRDQSSIYNAFTQRGIPARPRTEVIAASRTPQTRPPRTGRTLENIRRDKRQRDDAILNKWATGASRQEIVDAIPGISSVVVTNVLSSARRAGDKRAGHGSRQKPATSSLPVPIKALAAPLTALHPQRNAVILKLARERWKPSWIARHLGLGKNVVIGVISRARAAGLLPLIEASPSKRVSLAPVSIGGPAS